MSKITKKRATTTLIFSQIWFTVDLLIAIFVIPNIGVHLHHVTQSLGFDIFFLCWFAEFGILRLAWSQYFQIVASGKVLDIINGVLSDKDLTSLYKILGKEKADKLIAQITKDRDK